MFILTKSVYLDHNATTPLAPEVRKAMGEVMKKACGNASSLHTHGRVARGIVEQARKPISALLGCPCENILFTSGGTEGNNAVIKGVFASAGIKGHIVTSLIEHESVLGACRQVEALGGEVTYVPAGRDGTVDPLDIKKALRPETILVSVMHANNETGAVQPVGEIAKLAREAGVPMHTDAVQSFGKIRTNVDELGCEFLTVSAHKINGPKGAGAIYWRGGSGWQPLVFGGDQERGMRAGTEGVHQIAGFGKAAEISSKKMKERYARMTGLREAFIGGLRRIFPNLLVNEALPGSQLPGTVNITFPGRENIRLLAALDCYGVSVSIGSACTADRIEPSHVLIGMGIPEGMALSSIRVSMGATTTLKDVRYTLKVFSKILKGDPAGFSYLDSQHLDRERIFSGKSFIIDLRFPHERMLSPSVPGANEWAYINFDRSIKKVPRDREVILMCATGILSSSAGYRLAKAGHPKVFVVYGGYSAWKAIHSEVLREPRVND